MSQQKTKTFQRLFDYLRLIFRTKNVNIKNILEVDRKRSIRFFLHFASKVYVHATEEVTTFDILPQFLWERPFFVDLLVTLTQTFTTKDVEQLSPAQRKCIFQSEVDLKYFKSDFYSSTTCTMQCRMEKANKLCKCIPPFYLPSTGSHRECVTRSELECVAKYRHNITSTKGCLHCLLGCLNTIYEKDKLTQV
jgi:acid-sensing ion channel, other